MRRVTRLLSKKRPKKRPKSNRPTGEEILNLLEYRSESIQEFLTHRERLFEELENLNYYWDLRNLMHQTHELGMKIHNINLESSRINRLMGSSVIQWYNDVDTWIWDDLIKRATELNSIQFLDFIFSESRELDGGGDIQYNLIEKAIETALEIGNYQIIQDITDTIDPPYDIDGMLKEIKQDKLKTLAQRAKEKYGAYHVSKKYLPQMTGYDDFDPMEGVSAYLFSKPKRRRSKRRRKRLQ